MAKEERSGTADKRQSVLIGYVAICVVVIFMTLVLALTPEDPAAVQQVTQRATSTRNPIILTAQADYATVAPEHRDEHGNLLPTPTRGGS